MNNEPEDDMNNDPTDEKSNKMNDETNNDSNEKGKKMKNSIKRIKKHLKENKTTYLVGAGCFVVGVIGTMFLVQRGNLYLKVDGDDNNINGLTNINNAENVTIVQQTINIGRGRPGNPVMCDQTRDVFKSQELAAIDANSSAVAMSRHLAGMYPDLKGRTYTRLVPEA